MVIVNIHNKGSRTIAQAGSWFFWEEQWIRPQGDEKGMVRLVPGERAQIRVPVLATSRGPCLLRGPVVFAVDPWGLMRARLHIRQPELLAIRPRVVTPPGLEFLVRGSSGGTFALVLDAKARRSEEFLGLREYREGDEVRTLDHRAWARLGRPVTREFGQERGQGVVLLVETACGTFWERGGLDPMLRVAAGVAQWLFERGVLGRLVLDGREIDLGLYGDPMEGVLEALALVRRPLWWAWPKPCEWDPEARALGPVLAVGCAKSRVEPGRNADEARIQKRILVVAQGESVPSFADPQERTLVLPAEVLS